MLNLNKIFIILFLSVPMAFADSIKTPNVAGSFYPSDKNMLVKQINNFNQQVPSLKTPKPLIVVAPHAGYVYSGSIAAYAFKAIKPINPTTIIVIAPSHFYPFKGAAIWPRGGFKTPLGIIGVDEDLAKQLMLATGVLHENPDVFNQEHALEVELPFIQQAIGSNVKIVPILMGQPDFKACEDLARALNRIIGNRQDIAVVISSDMSHYHPYDQANTIDAKTLTIIKEMDIEGFFKGNMTRHIEMCGFVPVTVGMMLAKLRGLSTVEVLKYANSGDTAFDKNRVVGYGAIAFHDNQLTNEQGQQLLTVARQAIKRMVQEGKVVEVSNSDNRLNSIQGAFVTIHANGQLRGCIGTIVANQPLIEVVRDMAIAAATKDPRFKPLTPQELENITVEVSVLSIPLRVSGADDIALGRDGVIVADGNDHQGVFLPQVAEETGWSKEEFLNQLCEQKAGLSKDCWKDQSTALYTFTAQVFHE